MAADTLVAELGAHVSHDEVEAGDVERVGRLVASEADPWSRRLPLHLTASALVVDPVERRVLLRWHAKQRRWLQVGGHADPGETEPWAVALREAVEETGLGDLRPWPGPGRALAQVAVVPVAGVGDEPPHEHADLRYLLATDRPGDVPDEVEGVPLRWCCLEDARALADAGLRRLLAVVESLW